MSGYLIIIRGRIMIIFSHHSILVIFVVAGSLISFVPTRDRKGRIEGSRERECEGRRGAE